MNKYFRRIRITLALLCWAGVTLLFLDFTGTIHTYLGWMAKMQLLPAVLSMNLIALGVLLLLTLLLGRFYCSVICPLGVMQDAISWLSQRRLFRSNKRAKLANKFGFKPALNAVRYAIMGVFIVLMCFPVTRFAANLIAPYSAYGRMASALLQPVWVWGNNVLAAMAEHYQSYAFYEVEVWNRGLVALAIPLVTLVIIGAIAATGGRTYCNTICPVGSLLGLISRFSLVRPSFDEQCTGCGICERNCKSSCIDVKNRRVDMSRCVMCGDCLDNCPQGHLALGRGRVDAGKSERKPVDEGKRAFLIGSGLALGGALLRAQEKKVDGGLAIIEDKVVPERKTPILPPGSLSLRNMQAHCIACQLCVSNCPNGVLRPSSDMERFMMPEASYERGYCRPECNRCSQVCPTGAIKPITVEERTSVQVGRAVWYRQNCVPVHDGVHCGNCARHCPAGAIQMVPMDSTILRNAEGCWARPDGQVLADKEVLLIPVVNEDRCIGCGACEHLCPSRPLSAIRVEGYQVQRNS